MRQIISTTARDYGETAKSQVHLNALAYRGFLGLLGLDGDRLKRAISTTCAVIAKRAPQFIIAELGSLAIGADIPLGDIVLLNARSEMLSIWANWRVSECTSVAIAASRSEDGVARIAQNWDWLTVMRDLPVIVQAQPAHGPAYVSFCEAGHLAKIGVNEAGLAVGLNFLEVPRNEIEFAKEGLPVHLLIRAVLAEKSVSGALDALRELPRGGAANLVLADAGGAACCVEVRPSRIDVIDDGITTHANDFEAGGVKPLRSARLARLLEQRVGRDGLFLALRNHGRALEQICAHPDSPLSSSTIASIVVDCVPPALWVARGTPCEKPEIVRYSTK